MNVRFMKGMLSLGALLLPTLCWAGEGDELKLSEPALSAQRLTFGVIGFVVLAGIVFYYVRRWQTLHSGNTVDGGYPSDD